MNNKAEKSEDFCLDFVQEFSLCLQCFFEFAVSGERLLIVAVSLHSSSTNSLIWFEISRTCIMYERSTSSCLTKKKRSESS